jgi:RNA polymerase sigma-70 factor, ECF subfamily
MSDEELLDAILAGDSASFAVLVRRYQSALVRVAGYYVSSTAAAEDVVQETWIAVIEGASAFERRSSFKTWLFRILSNRAKTAGVRDRRTVSVDPTGSDGTVAASRFDGRGMWSDPPTPFTESLEQRLDDADTLRAVRECIADLPEPMRAVVTLRDVEGLSTDDVASLLGLTQVNVRVTLHRGRAKVRDIVERTVRSAAP